MYVLPMRMVLTFILYDGCRRSHCIFFQLWCFFNPSILTDMMLKTGYLKKFGKMKVANESYTKEIETNF